MFHGGGAVINFSQLPEWFNRNLWVKQVMQSGLKGKYVMAINEDGWITKIKSLDINLPVKLSIEFRKYFKQSYELYESRFDPEFILEAHHHSLRHPSELPYLYHYASNSISQLTDWYDIHYVTRGSATLYHDNDAIARKTLSAPNDERVVIFEVTPDSGWSKPLQWNPKAMPSLSLLFGGESHD